MSELDSARAARLCELVPAALELAPPERAEFLRQACGEDKELQREVESLLGHEAGARDFMSAPKLADVFGKSLAEEGELRAGETLGDYSILHLLGEGGMGEVYLAEDTKLGRQVAIKLIKSGFGTKEFVRHFQQEERILAALNHPNIARLYGGAVTEKGLPFFVMEYVEGTPLTEYAQTNSLREEEKLNLFRRVCAAVSYAHQNLVLHRDLKPANIRVTPEGEPKLLDFGIARLLDPDTAATHDLTIVTTRVMTPDYASPEQRRGDRMTTASDTYSLGIVLYELLAGEKPRHRKDGQPELKKLGGDLDNIVAKALRPEPDRRYASVGQFSEDIRRYLEGLPISARKDTLGYRASKFAGRNRLALGAAAIILATLLSGIVITVQEKRKADRRFNDVRHLAHSLLYEIQPQIANLAGATGAGETLIRRGLEYLDSLAGEAGGDRSLQRELGEAYFRIATIQGKPSLPNLGDTAGSIVSYHKAEAIFASLLAGDPTDQAVQRDLAWTYQYCGQVLGERMHDWNGSLENERKAVAIFESLVSANPGNLECRLTLVTGYNYLATATADHAHARQSLGEFRQALKIHDQAIAAAAALSTADPASREYQRQVAASHQRLGYSLRAIGELTGEMDNYLTALEHDRKAKSIYEALAAAEPTNSGYRRDAADAALSIGQSQLLLGDAVGALVTERQAAATLKALAEADPLNMQARADVRDARIDMQKASAKTGESRKEGGR